MDEATETQVKYAHGTPINKRLVAEVREGTWYLLTQGVKPGRFLVNHLGLTAIGTGAGAYFFEDPTIGMGIGAIIGTITRMTPWTINRYLVKPWYNIQEGMVGVIFNHGKLFREGQAYGALNNLEQIRTNLKAQEEEISPEELLYRNNPESFLSKAKIVGPGRHYKKKGTNYISVDTDEWNLNPGPKIFPASTEGGVVIDVEVDPTAFYRKLPIPFALKYGPKLFRGEKKWEEELEKKLVSEVYDLIGGHFEKIRFPQVLQSSVDTLKGNQVARRIVRDHGVELRLLREGKKILASQESQLRQAMIEQQNKVEWGRMYRSDFTNTVALIKELTKGQEFTPDFYKMLDKVTEFRKGSLERFTLSDSQTN